MQIPFINVARIANEAANLHFRLHVGCLLLLLTNRQRQRLHTHTHTHTHTRTHARFLLVEFTCRPTRLRETSNHQHLKFCFMLDPIWTSYFFYLLRYAVKRVVIDGVTDTCLRLCLCLSTCTLRDTSPLCCVSRQSQSARRLFTTHEHRPAHCVPLAAVPRPAICTQIWRCLTNCTFVISVSKRIDSCDVCCTQPAG